MNTLDQGLRKWLAVFLPMIAFTILTLPGAKAQGLMFSGYADLEAGVGNPFGDGDSEFFFDNHHFNFIALGKVYQDLFVNAEVEYEHAGDEIALEYGFLAYTGLKNVRIMAGKFLVPFGRFNKDLHPTWINKMVGRPLGFSHVMPVGYNDVGLWVSSGLPLNGGRRATFDVFVVNGLMGDPGGDIRGLRDNIDDSYPNGGTDNNKAVGGRAGLEFAPEGFDIGGSVYHGRYSNDPSLDLKLTLLGLDASYHHDGLELRGEIVHANQETTGETLKRTGGYFQTAYRINQRWEPVVRIGYVDMPGRAGDRSRISAGINFYISSSSSVRLDFQHNIERSGFKVDNDAILTQFNVVF